MYAALLSSRTQRRIVTVLGLDSRRDSRTGSCSWIKAASSWRYSKTATQIKKMAATPTTPSYRKIKSIKTEDEKWQRRHVIRVMVPHNEDQMRKDSRLELVSSHVSLQEPCNRMVYSRARTGSSKVKDPMSSYSGAAPWPRYSKLNVVLTMSSWTSVSDARKASGMRSSWTIDECWWATRKHCRFSGILRTSHSMSSPTI